MDRLRARSVADADACARVADDPWAMPDERGLSIWICRGLERPLTEIWPHARHYE